MKHRSFHSKAAFTLVELSIVIVIIGLLTGGVLVGQELIHAAQLRSLTRQYDQYQTAFGAFKNKYNAIPGDMKNAVRYWGEADGGTADGIDSTCAALDHTHPSTGTETCNGNGDGLVVGLLGVSPPMHEAFRSWQHLANAGLVEGAYTGVPTATAEMIAAGVNMPVAKGSKGLWAILGLGYLDAIVPGIFEGDYGNVIALGDISALSLSGGALPPLDAYSIDSKIDDGKPQSGSVRSFGSALAPNCVVGTDDAYKNTSTTSNACILIFISGY